MIRPIEQLERDFAALKNRLLFEVLKRRGKSGVVLMGTYYRRLQAAVNRYNRAIAPVKPRRPRATFKQAIDRVVSEHGDTLRELGSR